MRFQTPLPDLSDRQLADPTAVDHHDHEALLALDHEEDAVGVARFVRVATASRSARSSWPTTGRAAASPPRCWSACVERAREEGVQQFTALILAENTEARRLLERLGNTTGAERAAGRARDRLPARAESSASLRLILAGAARGLLIPAISMWRQVADFTHRRAESRGRARQRDRRARVRRRRGRAGAGRRRGAGGRPRGPRPSRRDLLAGAVGPL